MADALDCSRGTVKSRLSRALGRLRATLGDDSALAGDEGGSSRV
jgi:DNA-directed RNA polymerase specialized sigma24 family protein